MKAREVQTPFSFHHDEVDEHRPAGNTLSEAVRYALDDLDVFGHHGTLSAAGPDTSLRGRVLLVALCPGTVLAVGVSSLAHAVRELFTGDEGFTGWQLAALPATRTPLHHLKPHLPTRQYNVLARRYEFATVEEVTTVPDDVWPDMAAVGPSLLRALEAALASVSQQGSSPPDEHTTTTAPGMAEHGWRLQVSPDGTQATVHAPSPVVLTALSENTVQLTHTAGPGASPEDGQSEVELVWSTELAEQILRRAQPSGSVFLRALIDAGGTATAEQLRERTGLPVLHHATQTLTIAAAAVLARHHPEGRRWRRFVSSRPHLDQPRGRVYDYQLPEHLVDVFAEALARLGR